MGCKVNFRVAVEGVLKGFNRNIMGCKVLRAVMSTMFKSRFNRNIMGCKGECYYQLATTVHDLIGT